MTDTEELNQLESAATRLHAATTGLDGLLADFEERMDGMALEVEAVRPATWRNRAASIG